MADNKIDTVWESEMGYLPHGELLGDTVVGTWKV